MTIALNNEHSHLSPALRYRRYDPLNYFYASLPLSFSLLIGYGLFECIKIRDISHVQGRVFQFQLKYKVNVILCHSRN